MIAVGDKVVCVDDRDQDRPWFSFPGGTLQAGRVYVVEEITMFHFDLPSPVGPAGLALALYITGKPRIDIGTGETIPYGAERFRKLEDYRMQRELEYLRSLPKPEVAEA